MQNRTRLGTGGVASRVFVRDGRMTPTTTAWWWMLLTLVTMHEGGPVEATSTLPGELGHDCNLAGAFYQSAPLALDGCVTQCEADRRCQGFTWKHVNSSGAGVAVTANCTGKVGQPCCYFQAKSQIVGRGSNSKFDCWEKSGLPPAPPPPPPPPPPSFTGDGVPPFYADPVFDAAHDAELVWHEGEQCWWMTYLQNRYNSPLTDPAGSCAYCVYTDIGLASTPDHGKTWVYRGVAEGVDLPVSLRNASDPSTRPPVATSQMYGGATWWRPAVVRHNGIYHGFWVYNPDPGLGMRAGAMKIVHYTSIDLKHWQYAEIARGDPVAYDSNVFKVGSTAGLPDGGWLLFSTMQGRNMSDGMPRPLQSSNLYNWTECEDSAELLNVGEGPHLTGSRLNDATSTWEGFAWMNWEGGGVARSNDRGASWELQPTPLLFDSGTSGGVTDFGSAHQGPLVPQGDKMYVLYFSEFLTSPPDREAKEVNSRRSMLHLREVVRTDDGWLTCNRSDTAFLANLELAPPEDSSSAVTSQERSVPTVWYVALDEASVIALAELNRWHGGWYTSEKRPLGCSQRSPPPVSCETGVYSGFRLGAGFYRELHTPTAHACVETCKSEPTSARCGGMTFKENATAGGLGTDCGVGFTCCYLMTVDAVGADPVGNCPLPCTGWDSWAKVGITKGHTSGQSAHTPGYIPNFGKWRDPAVAKTFISNATRTGAGPGTQWKLQVRATHHKTQERLAYDFTIAANGTILSMQNVTAGGLAVQPLRQWRRVPPFH